MFITLDKNALINSIQYKAKVNSAFEILRNKYGPVLTLKQLAETLSRKPEGLRMALIKKEKWAAELNSHKFYIGRRVYFPVEIVATLLNGRRAAADE